MSSMKLGEKIKKIRELKNFSQENMADELGMTTSGYGRIERNEVDVNYEKLEKIAQVLNVEVEDIIKFNEKQVFYFSNNQTANGYLYTQNNFPPELKQLYEDKIALLEEKIKWLEKGSTTKVGD